SLGVGSKRTVNRNARNLIAPRGTIPENRTSGVGNDLRLWRVGTMARYGAQPVTGGRYAGQSADGRDDLAPLLRDQECWKGLEVGGDGLGSISGAVAPARRTAVGLGRAARLRAESRNHAADGA